MELKITYRGWTGHFICADRCQFRLNTLLELGEDRIVVSTVGLLRLERGDQEFSPIGFRRHYETMAFKAHLESTPHGDFWDADVNQPVSFNSTWAWPDPKDKLLAQAGHETVVAEIAARMKEGEL